MIQKVAKPIFSEGVVVGLARIGLAALYASALFGGIRSADATAVQVMALVFITIYAFVLDDWREALLVLFAPDASLWRPPTGWNLFDRLGMAACRHAVLWIVVRPLLGGLPICPERVVPLPLLASSVQQGVRAWRRRLAASHHATRGHGAGSPAGDYDDGPERAVPAREAPAPDPVVRFDQRRQR